MSDGGDFIPCTGLSPRQERFAQALADGKSAFEAHALAGYRPNRGNASVLKHDQSIQKRVDEILKQREQIHAQATAKALEAQAVTKGWVIGNLKTVVTACLPGSEHANPQAANQALNLLGKELGMFVDRSKQEVSGGLRMTHERLLDYLDHLPADDGGADG